MEILHVSHAVLWFCSQRKSPTAGLEAGEAQRLHDLGVLPDVASVNGEQVVSCT